MDENGFYITLPSNACAKIFPQNTSSAFTIQLARPLELRGAWEVGLVEIQYPHSWDTLIEDEDVAFDIVKGNKKWLCTLQPGYYASIAELLENMNNEVKGHFDPPQGVSLHYDTVVRKVFLEGPPSYELATHGRLAHILGMQPGVAGKQSVFSVDLSAGFNTLFVYTDIVRHQIVGDYYVPLLRCVPIRGVNSEFVTLTFDKPHYIPVNKDHANTISVEIKTDQNRNVSFRFGKVIVKLHLRPQRNLVF